MILLLIILWYSLGLLGSYLGNRALRHRYPEVDQSQFYAMEYVLALIGPVNIAVVLAMFGRDCFK